MCAAMLNKLKRTLGLVDDEFEETYAPMGMPSGEEMMVEEPLQSNPMRRRHVQGERKPGSNIIPMTPNMTTGEMIICEPKSFDEAATIVDSLRSAKAVIVNLSNLEKEQAQRLIDFVAGATFAIDGNQQKVGEGIFIFTPRNILINPLATDQEWLNRENKELFWRVK